MTADGAGLCGQGCTFEVFSSLSWLRIGSIFKRLIDTRIK